VGGQACLQRVGGKALRPQVLVSANSATRVSPARGQGRLSAPVQNESRGRAIRQATFHKFPFIKFISPLRFIDDPPPSSSTPTILLNSELFTWFDEGHTLFYNPQLCAARVLQGPVSRQLPLGRAFCTQSTRPLQRNRSRESRVSRAMFSSGSSTRRRCYAAPRCSLGQSQGNAWYTRTALFLHLTCLRRVMSSRIFSNC
jgi:hypothetical protein